MYQRKSVGVAPGVSPGSPTPKNANVTIIFADDVLSRPQRDEGGVKMLGNFVLKPGAQMLQVYMTAKKQKPGFEGAGDVDELTITQKFEGMYPGNSLEIKEFIQNTIGKDVIVMYGTCVGKIYEVYGTACSPMRLKPSFTADDTKTGYTLSFEQTLGTGSLPGTYEGEIILADPFAQADENLALLQANGVQYQLSEDAAATALDVFSLDHEHGTVISLIGAGGADPYVLSQGAQTGVATVTVILKDGTDWAAAKNAVLDLRVYEAGGTTYLIEEKRA